MLDPTLLRESAPIGQVVQQVGARQIPRASGAGAGQEDGVLVPAQPRIQMDTDKLEWMWGDAGTRVTRPLRPPPDRYGRRRAP